MKRWTTYPILTSALVAILSGAAAAQEKTYEGVGSIAVVGGDVDNARKRALDDAFRQAIDQAVAEVVPEEARKTHADTIKKRILRRAKAYVVSHKVLEEKEEGGAYLVHIEAHVSVAMLQKELAALGIGAAAAAPPGGTPATPASGRIKVTLLLVTGDGTGVWSTFGQNAGDPGPVAPQLVSELDARGFQVVSAIGAAVPVAPEGGGGGDVPVSDAQAAEVARAVGARAAVVGKVFLRDGGHIRGTTLLGGEAEVALRVLEGTTRVAEAQLVGAGYAPERPAAMVAAARNASAQAMRMIGDRLLVRWPPVTARPGAGVTVRVRGVARWSDAAELQKALAQAPGVRSVLPGRYAPQEIAFTVVGGDKGGLLRALQGAALTPAPIVQQPADGSLLVQRPAGQTVPGDAR